LETGTYTIDVYATDETEITKVKIKIEGPDPGKTRGWVDITASKNGDHYYYSWTVGEGDFSITARATNGEGRHADDTAKVTVVSSTQPPPEDNNPPSVSVVDPTEGQTISDETYRILVSASDSEGTIEKVELSIDEGPWTDITSNFDGTHYYYDWKTSEGGHTIDARATDDSGNTGYAIQVSVTVDYTAVAIEYELFIEIDYIGSHMPTPEVLTYIQDYYYIRGIGVTFYLDNITLTVIGLEINYVDGVNDDEFWAIEASCNDIGDDKYTGSSANFVSKYKWVLFGTSVQGNPGVVGYTYVITRGSDVLAGNYIFIADESRDDWAYSKEIHKYGAEAVVLMHEFGHSIGIAKWHPAFGEEYDSDTYSVMGYLNVYNAGLYWDWYYSDEYWATRNMEYYTI